MDLYISLRTDIIYYYYDWLKKRIDDGFFDLRVDENNVNRYKFQDFKNIYLFTKNPSKIIKRNFKYFKRLNTQHELILEISPCEKYFEESLQAKKYEFISEFKECAKKAAISSMSIAFSYAPIYLTSLTDIRWHIAKFKFFCKALNGYTNKAYISFHFNDLINKSVYDIIPLKDHEKKECIEEFKKIAKSNNMELLLKPIITDDINVNMNNGVVDISCNNMCKHHCLYCPYNPYALSSIEKNYGLHDNSSTLIQGCLSDKDTIHEIDVGSKNRQ